MAKQIGPYENLGPLGTGGMATVYKVKDTKGKLYALKVMHAHFTAKTGIVKRFKQEFEIGQSMNKNHAFVDMYKCEKLDGSWTILMEFVPGKTLEKIKVSPTMACAIIEYIARSLDGFHAKKFIHRDLKPDNIILLPNGHIKIMDYGVARDNDNRMTRTGTTMGTPLYMAPEQLAASKNITASADIFSLACILYRIIARKDIHGLPINVGIANIVEARAKEGIKKLPKIDAPKLQAFIEKCVHPEPENRIQNIKGFLSGLAKVEDYNKNYKKLIKQVLKEEEQNSKDAEAQKQAALAMDKTMVRENTQNGSVSIKKFLIFIVFIFLISISFLIYQFGWKDIQKMIGLEKNVPKSQNETSP